jgi:adenine-specific DNA-methyltransferase
MILKRNSSQQKLRGAYYTPLLLAEKIVDFFKGNSSLKTMLEPSCGDGVFFDALINRKEIEKFDRLTGIEVEKKEVKKLSQKLSSYKNLEVLKGDFFDFYKREQESSRYDLILGNPPYIRYQYLTEEQRNEMSEILVSHKMKSNKLINTWVAFVVACVHMLSDKGKIAFVIPAEILQVAYAADLRYYLSKNLANITIIAFKDLVFPNIEQEVVVFIGEKRSEKKGIRIVQFQNLDDLDVESVKKIEFQPLSNTQEKWVRYFSSKGDTDALTKIKKDVRFQKLSDCALINVGVTTGNNKYFSVDDDTAEKFDLKRIALPLIGRSSHANSVYFNRSDWEINVHEKKLAYLVNFPEKDYEKYSKKQKEYIQLGEIQGLNKGYKCSIREKWYRIPSIWIPDAFFLRRNNLYPKFVLNCCGAISTDTMHRMKFLKGIAPERVVLSYYNSISFAFAEICGRSYGGGVLEILPGEVGNIYVPVLDSVPIRKVRQILKQVDEIIRNAENVELALDIVDEQILCDYLNVEKNVVAEARSVWRQMQARRLTRSSRQSKE